MARRGCRVDGDRRLLPVKLVDGPDARAKEKLLNFEDLRIVGSDDENVGDGDGALNAIAVDPGGVTVEDGLDEGFDRLRFLRRAVLISPRRQ